MRSAMVCLAFLLSSVSFGQKITTPKEFLGFDVCQDYHLANYTQLSAYWQTLDKESDRLQVVKFGESASGRDQLMCVVSDPANLKNLESIRRANERLAKAKGLTQAEAARLAKTAKAVVWIDGGLHATEVLVGQQLIETAYRLVTAQDEETRRILKDCVILLAHANPDGQEWVADHYMRRSVPETRSLAGLPWLYQKYCGHDNNRDFYACNTVESRNINNVLYRQWYPQIVYNHHQSAPAGTVMFVPPFRNPFNFNIDPLTHIGTELVGTAIHQRLIGEGKRGTAMRGSTLYSTWWNGGLRTTAYFHNMVGILTETWGSPNPGPLPFTARFQVPTTDVPFPVVAGTVWHLRDSLEYEVSANYAILDYASRYRERILLNTYQAASNSVARGSTDSWSRYPSRLAQFGADALKKPELRDARMYVVPLDPRLQPDPGAARAFIDKLIATGIEVEVLKKDTGDWPAGSLIVRCDQAFRPHILDMFEPQDHPNDFQYPGGPPVPPYDSAGYTLAFQMGIRFDRVLDPVSLETAKVSQVPAAEVRIGDGKQTMVLAGSQNESYALVNLALKAGLTASRSSSGGFLVSGSGAELKKLAAARPFATASLTKQEVAEKPLTAARIAVWDRYGGSMESGWTQYVLDTFAFPYTVTYNNDIDAGDLRAKFDVILLPDGAVPGGEGRQGGGGGESVEEDTGADAIEAMLQQGGQVPPLTDDPTIPLVWRQRNRPFSPTTLASLKAFAQQGGHLVCIGSSALNIAQKFGLPVENAMVDEKGVRLPSSKFYIPGSILRINLKAGSLTTGMGEEADVMFDNSPSFRTKDGAEPVGTFASDKPLRSGWAWGQELLKGTTAVADVPFGQGMIVLIGPEVLFRGQPHGTFKLVFNAIYRSTASRQ